MDSDITDEDRKKIIKFLQEQKYISDKKFDLWNKLSDEDLSSLCKNSLVIINKAICPLHGKECKKEEK